MISVSLYIFIYIYIYIFSKIWGVSSVRTTTNREMCMRGEIAWEREACLPNAWAESRKFGGFSPAGFGIVFDDRAFWPPAFVIFFVTPLA